MYIAIGIAAALFAADRILKYLSRTGKLKWERRYVRLTHLENRGFFLGLGQKHEKLLRWLPLGVWLAAAACLLPEPNSRLMVMILLITGRPSSTALQIATMVSTLSTTHPTSAGSMEELISLPVTA